jgi:hypothetical protein
MELIVCFLVIIYVINNTFVYRFQRTTLGISRQTGDRGLQATLTPNWIAWLYWSNFILLIGLSILIFVTFSWLWLLIFLVYAFVVTPIIGVLFPIPSYKKCFEMIKKGLQKDIDRSKDENKRLTFSRLLEVVKNEECKIR